MYFNNPQHEKLYQEFLEKDNNWNIAKYADYLDTQYPNCNIIINPSIYDVFHESFTFPHEIRTAHLLKKQTRAKEHHFMQAALVGRWSPPKQTITREGNKRRKRKCPVWYHFQDKARWVKPADIFKEANLYSLKPALGLGPIKDYFEDFYEIAYSHRETIFYDVTTKWLDLIDKKCVAAQQFQHELNEITKSRKRLANAHGIENIEEMFIGSCVAMGMRHPVFTKFGIALSESSVEAETRKCSASTLLYKLNNQQDFDVVADALRHNVKMGNLRHEYSSNHPLLSSNVFHFDYVLSIIHDENLSFCIGKNGIEMPVLLDYENIQRNEFTDDNNFVFRMPISPKVVLTVRVRNRVNEPHTQNVVLTKATVDFINEINNFQTKDNDYVSFRN